MSVLKIIALLIYPVIVYVIYSGKMSGEKDKDDNDVKGWAFTILLLFLLLRLVNKE